MPLDSEALSAASIIRSINLPPRPALLIALQHEMRKETASLAKVAQLIGRDPAIAGALLQRASSASFGSRRAPATVQEAITLIGMEQCSAITTMLVVKRVVGAKGGTMMARYWDVSEKRAAGMQYLARKTGAAAPEPAYVFGLFCDVGIPLLKGRFADYLQTLAQANRAPAFTFLDVEQQRHGIHHARIGALLAREWAIAGDVVEAIDHHHHRDAFTDASVSASARALVALNFVVEKAIQGHRGEAEPLEWSVVGPQAAEILGLSMADVDQLSEALTDQFRSPREARAHAGF